MRWHDFPSRTFHSHPPRSRHTQRRGFVLLIVLVVIMILALAAYTFTDLMVTHYEAVEHNGREIQSRMLVDSGVEAIRMFLLQDKVTREESGGIYDNPNYFRGLPVLLDENPDHCGNVTILAPALDEYGSLAGLRFGLEDESARINLNALVSLFDNPASSALLQIMSAGEQGGNESGENGSGDGSSSSNSNGGSSNGGGGNSTGTGTGSSSGTIDLIMSAAEGVADAEAEEGEATPSAARDLLLTVPGMDEYLADAILDWIDEDDEPREFGCEIEYYSSLPAPYAPRNGPLITVEELLLVRGITPELLFGLDQNRNGTIDAHEMQAASGGAAVELEGDDGSLDRGLSAYFTLHGMEKNVNSYGEPRVDLNGQDLQVLHDQLSLVLTPEQTTFIVAYRMNGAFEGEDEAGESVSGELNLTARGRTRISSVFDLIDKRVSVQFEGDEEATILAPAFPLELAGVYLPLLMDSVTVNPAATIPGRININEAPGSILIGIPGMTEEIVDAILSARLDVDPADPNWEHESWPLVQGIVSLEEMRMLAPFLCAGGDVYRAQVVGYYQDGEASARAEVIVDATADVPRVVFWRDLSHLGRGYTIETLGATTLSGY
jgi:uncharacterized membrane protein YgcG